jgi:uncharacterized protein DUF3551
MRTILAGTAAVIVLLAIDIQPGSAQNPTRPFCIRDGMNGPGTWDCSYYNMKQCLASASGAGGTCYENPFYQGSKKAAPQRKQRERT